MTDSLPDCLNVKDKDGRFIVANPATAVLMKADSVAALIGKTDFDFYPADIAQRFREDDEAALPRDTSLVIEQQLAHRDGPTTTLSTLKSPLHDETGRIAGLITHNRDVTEKIQLEMALAESERRMCGDRGECIQANYKGTSISLGGIDAFVFTGGRKGSSHGSREQGKYANKFYTTIKTTYTMA